MYTLLIRPIKNVGDFLIVESAKKLLKKYKSDKYLFELHSSKPIDEYIDKINQSDAIIICGGPGYQQHFYPGIYPLTKDIDKIKVPIIPLGLGWRGFPGDDLTLDKFSFSLASLRLLSFVENLG